MKRLDIGEEDVIYRLGRVKPEHTHVIISEEMIDKARGATEEEVFAERIGRAAGWRYKRRSYEGGFIFERERKTLAKQLEVSK